MRHTPTLPDEIKNILIADDQKLNLVLTRKVLSELYPKAQIFEANNGREAVSLCLAHHFSFLLIDLKMPELNGWEAIKEIRQLEHHKKTFIILLTAAEKEESYCLKMGTDALVRKPVTAQKLLDKLTKLQPTPPDRQNAALPLSFNREALCQKIQHDESVYRALCQEIISFFRPLPPMLQTLLAKKDYEQLHNLLHKLKGTALNMHFEKLVVLTNELHKASSRQDTQSVLTSKIERLSNEINTVLALLERKNT